MDSVDDGAERSILGPHRPAHRCAPWQRNWRAQDGFGSVSKLGTTFTINVRMVDVKTLQNEGEREIMFQRCELEDLPGAVALLKTAQAVSRNNRSTRGGAGRPERPPQAGCPPHEGPKWHGYFETT